MGSKKKVAKKKSKVKPSGTVLSIKAWRAPAPRGVNTVEGPRTAAAGQWILDLGGGYYAIANDEQVQNLLKK